MLSRATLRQRIQLLAAGLAAALLLVGIVGPLTIRERDAAASDIRVRIEPLRRALSDLQLAMIDQESAVRGFVLTGEEAALDPYRDARRSAAAEVRRLTQLSRGDPVLAPTVRGVRDAIHRWQSDVAEAEVALVQQGRTEEAVESERSGTGQARFAAVRSGLRELRQALVAETVQADLRVRAARGRLTALLWVLIAAGGGFVVTTGVLLRRWITTPLAVIGKAVETVTEGARDHPIPAAGPPDIAALAANVEAMRAEMVRRLDDAVRARQALEQQAPAVVTLRAELAPQSGPAPAHLAFAAAFEPAEGDLAGDWYDLVALDEDRAVLLMVDVSGHGPGAGVFALRAKHLLHAALHDGPQPGEALAWLAERIGETGERFLTGVVAEVDTRRNVVRYANAGHPPPIVLSRDGVRRLEATGPLLGPLPGTWGTAEVPFPPGAQLVAYTDGLLEARDEEGRHFGEPRLLALLDRRTANPAGTAEACVDGVRRFRSGRVEDDLTVAVLRNGPPGRP